VAVDPNERELLAQFLGVMVVSFDVDRALEDERLVQAVQFVLDGLARRGSMFVGRWGNIDLLLFSRSGD
jgi:hypothetical protein